MKGDQLLNVPYLRRMYFCSATGIGSILEPLSAVPLNDELQQARVSVAKAEEDVLFMLTEKVWVRWFENNR